MFSGIVQGVGKVIKINDLPNLRQMTVALPQECSLNLSVGASVANNGCCLTITAICGNQVSFDLMRETLDKTNLGSLAVGDFVNIERAAKFGDEIGGHAMSGHIMATVAIIKIDEDANRKTLWFRLSENLQHYVFTKGFIGLDGCSLTVGEVKNGEFCVHLIPETLQRTLFGVRQVGDLVNLEIDANTQAIVDTVQRVLREKGLSLKPF